MPKHLLILIACLLLLVAACSGDAGAVSASSTTSIPRSSAVGEANGEPDEPADTVGTTLPEQSPATTQPPAETTTTSVAPAPNEVAPSDVAALGVVGCSNTGEALVGYAQLSSVDKLSTGDLGGGSITRWGDPLDRRYANYWAIYDQRRPSTGYEGAWVQLCIRTGEHQGAFDEAEQGWVTHIVGELQARDPSIIIWISPLNFYEGVVCESVGADGPAIAAEASDWAAQMLPAVQRGPDLGPLLPEHIGVRDNCHPSAAGELLLGSQLVDFFD